MLRTLLSRRWLAWMAFALAVATVFTFLGRWQWHRFETRHAAQNRISRNYDAPAVPVETLLGAAARGVPIPDQWRQVRLHGRYDRAHQVLVRNRPLDGNYGYEVVVPLRLDSGKVVFVDRGWVDNGIDARESAPVPPAPTDPVTVIGWLRPSEPNLHHGAIPGQIASINADQLSSMTVRSPYNAYVRMRSEALASGKAPARPTPLDKPDQGMSAWVNFSYALQWWAGAIGAIVFTLLRARREHLDSLGVTRAPKPKKTRIWDEEDE